MKQVFYGLGILVLALGLGWVVMGNELKLQSFFAPKFEQVRRNTFEQSKAYNQGTIQDLEKMQFEYVKSTPEQQKALASIILRRVADFDQDKLPIELRRFISGLRDERVNKY